MAQAEDSKFVPPKLDIQTGPSDTIPIPDDPVDCSEENDRRLWIGNLDTRVTEFALLKILQKFGTLQRFDFLYHKTGPDQGKPRGYCFVSYSNSQEAEKAMKSLDRKLALSKRMLVRWAHKQQDKVEKPVNKTLEESSNNLSAECKIRAIEMKLKIMEKNEPDFTLNTKPGALPGTSKYSSVQKAAATNQRQNSKPGYSQHQNYKPYSKRDGKR